MPTQKRLVGNPCVEHIARTGCHLKSQSSLGPAVPSRHLLLLLLLLLLLACSFWQQLHNPRRQVSETKGVRLACYNLWSLESVRQLITPYIDDLVLRTWRASRTRVVCSCSQSVSDDDCASGCKARSTSTAARSLIYSRTRAHREATRGYLDLDSSRLTLFMAFLVSAAAGLTDLTDSGVPRVSKLENSPVTVQPSRYSRHGTAAEKRLSDLAASLQCVRETQQRHVVSVESL